MTENYSRSFAHAIWTYQLFGKVDDIAWVLRSGRELTQDDREWLAGYLEGKRLPPRKAPFEHLLRAHKTLAIRAAANEVKELIASWIAAGEKRPGLNGKAIAVAA